MNSLRTINGELNLQNCDWLSVTTKKDGTEVIKLIPMELSNYIRNNLTYIFVRGKANEACLTYIYVDGYYKYISDDELKGFIKQFIPVDIRKSKDINEIFFDLKTDLKFINYELLNSNENYINFQDGMLNINTLELEKHDPSFYSTIQIPAKWEEIKDTNESEAIVFNKYMNDLTGNDDSTKKLLLQCLGIIISNIYAYRTKKALFLVGKGNSGKSQIKKLAEYLIGYQNVSNIDLKQLNGPFGTGNIYQKRLVGCNDMSYSTVEDMSIFKQLTGGDYIEINQKFQMGFPFLFKGFLWFNCNKLPRFSGDKGKWVYERIMPVYCNNEIPKEKQDPYLFDKLLKEKNIIIKMAIKELRELIENNYKFEETEDMIKSRETYEIENNTLLTFISECCEEYNAIPSLRTKRKSFLEAYDKWCKLNNNGKGKLSLSDIKITLEAKYKEHFIKSNGQYFLEKLILLPIAKKELGIYDDYD